jgi:hypothetical protein
MVVDLRAPLASLLRSGTDVMLEESWVSEVLCGSAERFWIWSPKGDRVEKKFRAERLGPVFKALALPRVLPSNLTAIQERVAVLGLSEALMVDKPLVGEEGMAFAPAVWRVLFVHDRLIGPVSGPNPLLRDIGFSKREMGAWLRARGVDPVPYGVASKLEPEDWMELGRDPGIRPAFAVVESFVEALWERGFLAAKPWRGTRSARGPLDPRMAGAGLPFWRPSDRVLAAIHHGQKGIPG